MRPPDEVRADIVGQWPHKAEQDTGAAEALLRGERPFFYPSCFHSQQAAEKYLKAFLTWRQIEFPKTHILGELLDLVAQADEDLAASLGDATSLNPYAVDARYPDDMPEPDRGEAEGALALARKVRDAVCRFLPRS